MKLALIAAAFAVLSAPLMAADMLEGVAKKVDATAAAADKKTDTGAQKADSAVSGVMGKGMISDAASAKIAAGSDKTKGKTAVGKTKVKAALGKAGDKKKAAADTTADAKAKADAAAAGAQAKAVDAINKIGQ